VHGQHRRAASAGADQTVRVWDLADAKAPVVLRLGVAAYGVDFSPAPSSLYSLTATGRPPYRRSGPGRSLVVASE
jgi:hypothetical protein